MNVKTLPFGVMGMALALAGLVGYSLTPDALWLVSLCEGLALACLIAFLIVHFETLKSFSARRSTRMGANSLVVVLLVVGILAIVNFLAARHSLRWDFSENQSFTLAPQTYRILRSLSHDVKVTVFTREKDPGFQSYKERLDSYRQASPNITVEFVLSILSGTPRWPNPTVSREPTPQFLKAGARRSVSRRRRKSNSPARCSEFRRTLRNGSSSSKAMANVDWTTRNGPVSLWPKRP
jgi:hypothetical protein